MARIVYFVASHINPEQVVRLARTLRSGSPESEVVIHHNYSVSHLDPNLFKGMDHVHILRPHVPVEWGGFSQIAIGLRFIDWALSHDPFDWAVLLSGQDYPIMPLQQIEQFLDTTDYDGFISAHRIDDLEAAGPVLPNWYFYHWYFYRFYKLKLPRQIYRLSSLLRGKNDSSPARAGLATQIPSNPRTPFLRIKYCRATGRLMLAFRRASTPFTSDFHCYHGSSWWTLSYRAIRYMSEFVRDNPDFVRFYKRTHLPEESFFLTILMNNPSLQIFADNKRYIRWSQRPASHPDILTAKDFPHIVSSGQHFARKIDQEVDVRLLDMLDRHINDVVKA